MKKKKLFVEKRPTGNYKIEMKGDGVLLYKTKQELDELISWDDYEAVFVEGKVNE